MLHELTIINPLDFQGWDDLILSSKSNSFFLTSNWARVLYESYHYKPLYFAVLKERKINNLIPFMEVRSALTGKRGVSLPFSDYCEPIIDDREDMQGLLHFIFSYAKDVHWKTIELRSGGCFSDVFPSSCFYYGHTLDITGNDSQIISNFRDSTNRNIKKAEKEGVIVNIHNSLESLKEFYHLNCMTRKEHGLPPQPFSFFNKIYEYIIAKNIGIIVLAEYKGKTIAGAVYFHFGDTVIYKYGASDKNHLNLRANNLVIWKAIQWYSMRGFQKLSLGRTEPENPGLLQFKRGWGGKEYKIEYYKYDLQKEAFVADSSKVSAMHNRVFHNMPISLLKITGSLLYKHIG